VNISSAYNMKYYKKDKYYSKERYYQEIYYNNRTNSVNINSNISGAYLFRKVCRLLCMFMLMRWIDRRNIGYHIDI